MTDTRRPMTVPRMLRKKAKGEKIAMLTAYDALFACLMDEAGIDAILVGDSLGMVVQGHDTTLPVTVDEMVYHTRAVRRGVRHALVVADMPFMSYQTSVEDALRNAARLIKEGGADAVKLEGGEPSLPVIRALVDAGIPVMGHVGLAPQSIKQLGTHAVQGRSHEDATRLLQDANAVERSGAFSLVIEAVPWPLARDITGAVAIPTIGIGAGPHCDGQVLVYADLLGLFTAFQPHFVRRFAHLGQDAGNAFQHYIHEVRNGTFPSLDESYSDETTQPDTRTKDHS